MSARSFDQLAKESPAASSVHVDSALGGGKKKARTFSQVKAAGYMGGEARPLEKRDLQPHDEKTAKAPFTYDPNFLGSLRPDQVPRFFGALTDSDKLPEVELPMDSLVATQDRVDPEKVKAIAAAGVVASGKLPVVVRHKGKHYIADGHHRLAGEWLAGNETAKVRVKDLEQVSNLLKRAESALRFEVKKVAEEQRQIFGWASVVTKDGSVIFDKQGHAIPPEELEAAAYEYVLTFRDQGHMHDQLGVGRMIESFVFTKQKQEALGIDLGLEGWWVGFKVDSDQVWESHKRGELPEFSIGGHGLLIPVKD